MTVLRDYQCEAVEFLLPRRRGMIVAPAGSGKTVIGANAVAHIAKPGWRVTWIANTLEQVEQAGTAFSRTEGPDIDLRIVCAASNPDTSDSDLVVFDEAHHLPAATWLAACAQSKGIVWGLTATPWHDTEEERNIVVREVFKEFFTIDRARVLASGHLVAGKVWMHDLDEPGQFDEEINTIAKEETLRRVRRYSVLLDDPGYIKLSQKIKNVAEEIRTARGADFLVLASRGLVKLSEESDATRALLEKATSASKARDEYVYRYHESKVKWQVTQEFVQKNPVRNSKVVELAHSSVDSTLILIQSIEHGEFLSTAIPGSLVMHSKLSKKKRAKGIEDFRSGALKCMLATSLADEGLDVPRASCLILAAGGRSSGKLEQRAGRVLRPFEGKQSGVIHDFMDRGCCFALAQARARMSVYERLGYEPDIVRHFSS